MLNIQAGINNIMKQIVFLIFCIIFFNCKSIDVKLSDELKLQFLDEFVLADDIMVDGTLVGGLSGIDYHNEKFYLVCDDSYNPRYYEAKIEISDRKISAVEIQKVVQIKDTTHFLDLESIRFNSDNNQILLTSEGHIKRQKNPMLFSLNYKGETNKIFEIPSQFYSNSLQKPRHNGTLEGMCQSIDGKGIWIAMELPLEMDGPEPKTSKTNSPVRITYINTNNQKLHKQFAYKLDAIAKQPKGDFAVNGLTEILEYDKNKFFIVERSFSSGLGNQGNTVKIFKVNVEKATNIVSYESLINAKYRTCTKELLFDLEDIRDKLTNNSVDNIEGISFGPKLPNGNMTLLLVADNNFNKLGEQLNQFILFEVID